MMTRIKSLASKKPFKAVVAILLLIALFTAFVVRFNPIDSNASDPNAIDTFAECAAAGNPVQESFPPRCQTVDGRVFTDESSQQSDSQTNDSTPDSITNLGDNSAELRTTNDTNKLSSEIYPPSFVAFMQARLGENKPDSQGCIQTFTINQVSTINIAGGAGIVSARSGQPSTQCGGGSRVVWYLKDGEWRELGIQAVPNCDQLRATTIYKEFVSDCYDQDQPDRLIPNPNGSLPQV